LNQYLNLATKEVKSLNQGGLEPCEASLFYAGPLDTSVLPRICLLEITPWYSHRHKRARWIQLNHLTPFKSRSVYDQLVLCRWRTFQNL